jgi:TatA/E family protein of Tat protein translocase
MFGPLGLPELLLIFAVALIVFGPRRLPEIGRTLGKALGEFKKAGDELKNTIEREVRIEELKQLSSPQTFSTTSTPLQNISRNEPAAPSSVEPAVVPPAEPHADA